MQIQIFHTPAETGREAALNIAERLRRLIAKQGEARLLLSTGASQFEMFETLVKESVDWSRVTMFHLDEYVGLPRTHKASFRRYLEERFVSRVNLREAVYVDGDGRLEEVLLHLSNRIREAPIDVGVIGIGENGHIAFNDPPADFDTKDCFTVVTLHETCRRQQVREGWFETVEQVPKQAVTMTVHQIMQSHCIISVVPHGVKAGAVKRMLETAVDSRVPATILKEHRDWNLYLDSASAQGFLSMPVGMER